MGCLRVKLRSSSEYFFDGGRLGVVTTPSFTFCIANWGRYLVSSNFCWNLCARLWSRYYCLYDALHAPQLLWSATGIHPLVAITRPSAIRWDEGFNAVKQQWVHLSLLDSVNNDYFQQINQRQWGIYFWFATPYPSSSASIWVSSTSPINKR